MVTLDFSRLNPTEFEEFCYELLHSLGFKDICWRKGTPLNASPSDQGRDIECTRHRTDIDGHLIVERWFVQCKHYTRAVPPEKIIDALTWAQAERPDVLLIMTSGFLSNPCLEYIETYKQKNKPYFGIRQWDKKHIEQLAEEHISLMNKFRLIDDTLFLQSMHPLHGHYLFGLYWNTLPYLLNVLESLDAEKRDKVMAATYSWVICPRSRKPVTGKEKIIELRIDKVDFEAFKEKCLDVRGFVLDPLFVRSIVEFTLASLHRSYDPYHKAETREDHLATLAYIEQRLNESTEEAERADLMSVKETHLKIAPKAESFEAEWDSLYEWFCENVIPALAKQEFKIKYKEKEFSDYAAHKAPRFEVANATTK